MTALAAWFLLREPSVAPPVAPPSPLPLAAVLPKVVEGTAVAVEYRRTDSPYMGQIVAAMKRALGADGGDCDSPAQRFLELSGLSEADARWMLLSMDAVRLDESGALSGVPDYALTVSFAHDLGRIRCAYDEVRLPDSPLSFEDVEIAGLAAVAVRARGWSGGVAFVVASLDGELLFIGPNERAVARQIFLYRDGKGADALFDDFAAERDNVFRLFVPNTGRLLSWALPPKDRRPAAMAELFSDGEEVLMGLRETDVIVVAGEDAGVSLKLAMRAASVEDAGILASILGRAGPRAGGNVAKPTLATFAISPEEALFASFRALLARAKTSREGDMVSVVMSFSGDEVNRAAAMIAALLKS